MSCDLPQFLLIIRDQVSSHGRSLTHDGEMRSSIADDVYQPNNYFFELRFRHVPNAVDDDTRIGRE